MSYYLLLDDIRTPSQVARLVDLPAANWLIVRSYEEFINTIEAKGCPRFVSFDMDLKPEHYGAKDIHALEETGLSCAQFLVGYCLKYDCDLPAYLVHSLNPEGAAAIKVEMEWAKRALELNREDDQRREAQR